MKLRTPRFPEAGVPAGVGASNTVDQSHAAGTRLADPGAIE